MEPTRELYLSACCEVAETLAPLGYRYARSGPHAQKADADFSYRISFQSSNKNVVGAYAALWIHGIVRSKQLEKWRLAQQHPLRTDDWVAGGQIGNLVSPPKWRDWNVAGASRQSDLADAISTVHSVALPYFARFANITSVCSFIQAEQLPAMGVSEMMEFLLCYADRTAAANALNRFFRSRPDLLGDYQVHLSEFRKSGLPRVRRTGFAYELAFATLTYDLPPASEP